MNGDTVWGYYNQTVDATNRCGTSVEVDLVMTCQNAAVAGKCCAGEKDE